MSASMNRANRVGAHRLDTKEDVNFSCERAVGQCLRIFIGLRIWGPNSVFTIILLTFSAAACRSLPPLPPVDLKQPGWTLREGQAVWKPSGKKSEIAGEVQVATRPDDGRSFVQFSKAPFPLVIAQSTTNGWQIEIPAENRRYSGKGNPPERIIWLYLASVLEGEPLP